MKGRVWFVVAVATYLGVMGCVIWPSNPPAGKAPVDLNSDSDVRPIAKLEGLPYRGIAMQVQRIDNLMDYGRCVDKIAEIGADTILFVVDSKQENGTSTRIFLDMRGEPTPEKLGELIQYAHNKKLRVILMPLVLLESPKGTEWRGVIHPEVWEDWWDSYREMLHHYATVAENNHVEVFVVGSELVSTEGQVEEWTRTIRQARKDFHGQLTYSANWDHYTSIPFWKDLDLIGMNSYYKLGENRDVTVDQIVARWREIQKDLFAFERRTGKPLLLLEAGWCSIANAAHEPWDYTPTSVPIDVDLQRKLYEGFFRAWWGDPHLGGFMLWEWPLDASGVEDRGYTPKGKPAERVMKEWFAKPRWTVKP